MRIRLILFNGVELKFMEITRVFAVSHLNIEPIIDSITEYISMKYSRSLFFCVFPSFLN